MGSAGGFAGEVKGGHIQDSNAENFSYVVGQVSAGGYAGTIAPGDVASVLAGNLGILSGLIATNGSFASLLQDFVPTVRNSEDHVHPVRRRRARPGCFQRDRAARHGRRLRGP